MEYFSRSTQEWTPTQIADVTQEGFSVLLKRKTIHPFREPPRVRRRLHGEFSSPAGSTTTAGSVNSANGSEAEAISASPAEVTEVEVGSERPRGEPDPFWEKKVRDELKSQTRVLSIFEKYEQTYPDGDAQTALGRMLRDQFPSPQLLQVSQLPDHSRGSCHPSDFAFVPSAWDLFFVYESDFVREVLAIVVDGLVQPGLQIQPFSVNVADKYFSWKPDGEYRVFVRMAAILFIAITSVEENVKNPSWLVSDLSELSVTCIRHDSALKRGLAALKNTVLASKQNRAADPLMIDHMLTDLCGSVDALSAVGSVAGETTTPDVFISRYNASVSYNPEMMLAEGAARRQVYLRDPTKCTPAMKALMRLATEEASSFAETGLSLEIMALPEFWIGCAFTGSSHPLWMQYGRTTEESCMRSLQVLFSSSKKGTIMTSSKFKSMARRLAFAIAATNGVFGRRSVSLTICDDMVQRVADGLYDEDIDNQINDCDEGAPQTDVLSMDAHLAEVSQFVQDGLELQATANASNPEDDARLEKASGMGEEEWVVAELKHEVARFLKAKDDRYKLEEARNVKNDTHIKRVTANVKEATSSFAEHHAPIVPLNLSSPEGFQKELRARIEFVARERRVDVEKVLTVFSIDLSILGGVMEDALKLCDMVTGLLQPKDILIVICHGASVQAPTQASPRASQVRPGLPVAPSDIGVASEKAANRAQLVADFDKVIDKMKLVPRRGQLLGCFSLWGRGGIRNWSPEGHFQEMSLESRREFLSSSSPQGREGGEASKFCGQVCGRFVQRVSLRFRGSLPVHAAVLQPEGGSGWQSLGFLEAGELSDLELPVDVVELAAGSVSKARKGQIGMKSRSAVAARSVSEKDQRGPDLYSKLYAQFERLGEAYRSSEGASRPILFCDLTAGVGDSAIAILDRAVARRRQSASGSGPAGGSGSAGGSGNGPSCEDSVAAFFTDPKEAHRIIAMTRRDIHMTRLYTDGLYRADGFEPVQKPADLKTMEDECNAPLPIKHEFLASVHRDGKYYLIFPEVSSLSVMLTGENAKTYEELRKGFPLPPAPRVTQSTSSVASGLAPNTQITMDQTLEKFLLLANQPITLAGQEFKILRAQSEVSGTVHYLLYNCSATRRTIPQNAHFTTTSAGVFVDLKLDPGSRAPLRENAIAWPWKLTPESKFVYSFSAGGSASEVVGNFGEMLQSARLVGGGGVQVYAHSLVAPTTRSGTHYAVPAPSPRDSVDIVLSLKEVSDVGLRTATLGDHFTKADLAEPINAMICPVYRVKLDQNLVIPEVSNRPLDFVTSRALTMEANAVMLLTTTLR